MDAPAELVSFLARSENRVEALLALAPEPATRADLQERTGVPRATLSRVLADFRDRDLAERRGYEYAATPLGSLLAAELRSLYSAIEVGTDLQALVPWLPLSELGVDVRDLADARVTLPTPVEPLVPVRRTAEVLGESERVRGLCNNVVPEWLAVLRRGVVENDLQVEVVATAEAFEAVSADPAASGAVGDLLDSGRLDLAVYGGPIPVLAIFADARLLLEVADEEGAIRGLVETESEAMTAWFESAFDAFRQDATRVAPEVLAR